MTEPKAQADKLLLVLFSLWLFFGLIMLTSASAPVGLDRFNDSYFFIKRQLLYGFLPGIFLFFVLARINIKTLQNFIPIGFGLILLSLFLIFVPGIGTSFGTGNQSWIAIAGQSFQPSEFLKLGLILFLAFYIAKKKNIEDLYEGFFPTLIVATIPLLFVIFQQDIGTASILFVIIFSLLFFAGAQLKHLFSVGLIGLVALSLLVAVAPYRVDRFMTFLNPELDPQNQGYQINQAYLAIGSGGIFGRGWGRSLQKFQYLPEVQADSIFAIIAEEMGFVVSGLLVALIVFIVCRIFLVAKRAPDMFSRLTASGIGVWFATQSFLNIGAIVGLLPLTGVPLLFISHGGTALITAMAGAGIVLNISRDI
jgi:cell division protein FtsW